MMILGSLNSGLYSTFLDGPTEWTMALLTGLGFKGMSYPLGKHQAKITRAIALNLNRKIGQQWREWLCFSLPIPVPLVKNDDALLCITCKHLQHEEGFTPMEDSV